MRFTNSLQKVFLQYLEFSHVKIIFRSSKHNFLVVFLAVKSISFLGWVLNLLTLKNIAINFMVSFTTNNSILPQKNGDNDVVDDLWMLVNTAVTKSFGDISPPISVRNVDVGYSSP